MGRLAGDQRKATGTWITTDYNHNGTQNTTCCSSWFNCKVHVVKWPVALFYYFFLFPLKDEKGNNFLKQIWNSAWRRGSTRPGNLKVTQCEYILRSPRHPLINTVDAFRGSSLFLSLWLYLLRLFFLFPWVQNKWFSCSIPANYFELLSALCGQRAALEGGVWKNSFRAGTII